MRPDYLRTQQGINKAKSAIENSLSKTNGFNFLDMRDVIEDIVQEEKEVERLAREKEELELKLLEKELKHEDEPPEEIDPEESSESQAGIVNNVNLHKVMGVPKDAKGVSDVIADKLKKNAEVSEDFY